MENIDYKVLYESLLEEYEDLSLKYKKMNKKYQKARNKNRDNKREYMKNRKNVVVKADEDIGTLFEKFLEENLGHKRDWFKKEVDTVVSNIKNDWDNYKK